MYIQSIKSELLLDKYEIIEVKVRGKEEARQEFFSDIQDVFDLAYDEWDESLAMLTMTFDKKPEEQQTINQIKRYTKEYIDNKNEQVTH